MLSGADRQSITNALPNGSRVLVEFIKCNFFDFVAKPALGESYWKPAHYLAFILHAEASENVWMIDLGEAKQIDNLILKFRNSIAGGENMETTYGLDLRSIVFDPLKNAIAPSQKTLCST